MAKVFDDEEASRLAMLRNSFEDFENRSNNASATYALCDGEILKEEYPKEESVDSQMLSRNMDNKRSSDEQEESYFVPFEHSISVEACLQNNIKALEREEDTFLHQRNHNESLNLQFNASKSENKKSIQREQTDRLDYEEQQFKSERPETDNLSKLTIKKSKEETRFFIKKLTIDKVGLQFNEDECNRKRINERAASIERKRRLRNSSSATDSSLINDKKIKKQEVARSVKRKRNWFFHQISNSSKSYDTSSPANCDTCSIITNQDTMNDNVFDDTYASTATTENGDYAVSERASASSLLNQTRNKLAQFRSQIKQQTSVESDQSVLTTTTVSLNGESSNTPKRVGQKSSYGLKNLFRKRKKRLTPTRTNGQSEKNPNKSADNLNNINSNRKLTKKQESQQNFNRKDQNYNSKLKSKHIHKVRMKRDRDECIGGIKSRPLQKIVHPSERSVTGFFVVTLFLTMLALISGVPIVCLLCLCLPVAVGIRNLIACDFLTSCSVNEHKCTPAEHYWINSNWQNNCKKGQALCLFMINSAFTLEKCRDLIQSRLIQKVGTERFRWVLRYKGLSRSPCWQRIPVSEFDINQHISSLKPINNTKKLKEYVMKLMHVPLDLCQQPGWYIHYVRIHGKLKTEVALIIRVHQALFDGINLSKILIGLLSDQAPIMFSLAEQRYEIEFEKQKHINKLQMTTSVGSINNPFFNNLGCSMIKPRFGGYNFPMNVYRAIIVGPLTFTLWMLWAFTRRNYDFLFSSKFFLRIHKFVKTIDLNSLNEDEELDLHGHKKSDSNFLNVTQTGLKRHNMKNQSNKKRSPISCSEQSSLETHSKFTPSTTLTTTTSGSKYRMKRPEKAIYWTSIPFALVQRVKQVTRSSLNDVVLSCVAGAVREYLVNTGNIANPPDLGITLPVDISVASDHDMENLGVNYVFLTAPLPTSIESSISRLWEIRNLTEELKTSADPAVMNGVTFFLHWLLPTCLSNFLLNFIHRNSSVCLSNLQGPKEPITFYTHPVHSINYWMSTPPNIPVSFNVLTYGDQFTISISTSAQILPCARRLGRLLKQQFNNYHELLARRRIPGERSRLRQLAAQYAQFKQPILPAAYLATKFKVVPSSPESAITQIGSNLPDDFSQIRSSRSSSIRITPSPTTSTLSPTTVYQPMTMAETVEAMTYNIENDESIISSRRNTLISTVSQLTSGQLADRLNDVQLHLYDLSEQLQEDLSNDRKEQLEIELDEYKERFNVLMKQIRRRKSMADYSLHNVVINVESEFDEEDDIDGELLPPVRRFSFGVSSRRSSVVSTSAISIPTIPARFNVPVSPPNLLTRRSIIPTSSPEPSSSPERRIKEETV